MVTWIPDFCPSGACKFEVQRQGFTMTRALRLCAHHQALRDDGRTDQHVFDLMVQSCRIRERARWEVKLELGLAKDDPMPEYRVEPDGSFVIMTRTTDQFVLASIRERVARATAGMPRPIGTSLLAIE